MLTESEMNRNIVLLSDSNKITRQKALQSLCNDFKSRLSDNDNNLSPPSNTLESMLKILSDPAEKNRDLALTYISMYTTKYCTEENSIDKALSLIIPALVQRLGTNDIIEPSEEIRLKSITLLYELCRIYPNGNRLGLYLNEWVIILKRTIIDPYPEVRKLSCELTSKLAAKCHEKFHLMSESLIKPIIETMKHQHAKIRVEAINALGNVIRYGNNKSVEDSVSPLAQRFFDHTSTVRLAVINVVGIWMLELRDRYSYFHMMLPLVLTGYTDEIEEIRETTDSLWWDIGLKYEKENEEDLKDQINFPHNPKKYPPNLTRPNLGCRELVKRNLIRILPAIRNDLTDWVVAGRIKSAQLLAILTWQAEETITQHLEDTLQVCSKAIVDDETIVREQVNQSLIYIGYFVPIKTWFNLIRSHFEQSSSLGLLRLIAPLLQGVSCEELIESQTILDQLLMIILKSEYTDNFQITIQHELLRICRILIEKCQDQLEPYAYRIFKCILSLLSIVENDELKQQCKDTLNSLALNSSVNELYEKFASKLFDDLKRTSDNWLRSSRDRFIFETFIMQAGSSNRFFLNDIVEILRTVMNPERDPEVRNQCLLIIANLLQFIDEADMKTTISPYLVIIINECILPNMQWKAGRTAGAIRATAIATLWSLFQAKSFSFEQSTTSMNEIFQSVLGMLDDDDRLTRMNCCYVLQALFSNDDAIRTIDNDRLHKAYPDLLKRLDDVSDDIRLLVCSTVNAYIQAFHGDFTIELYRAHVEDIAKILLIHMDDQNTQIQNAVFDTIFQFATQLKDASETFINEIRNVKHKHRNQTLCDTLTERIEKSK
ncbi:unnamed protein product [Adineta steineri]|uniref:Uncharacterized protein n=1 Tax=Adineta steineri TaxID=433720 RepID=A0A815CIJ1_9BILA|nr:unnamed protein product [Adineta steineri]CAF4033489.1 unnamed protein product [Adineta steineri]